MFDWIKNAVSGVTNFVRDLAQPAADIFGGVQQVRGLDIQRDIADANVEALQEQTAQLREVNKANQQQTIFAWDPVNGELVDTGVPFDPNNPTVMPQGFSLPQTSQQADFLAKTTGGVVGNTSFVSQDGLVKTSAVIPQDTQVVVQSSPSSGPSQQTLLLLGAAVVAFLIFRRSR